MRINSPSKDNISFSQEGKDLDIWIFGMVADIYFCE